MTELAAVLWDLDGTIVDTEPLWMAAEHELADQHGAVWTEEDGLALVGNTLIESGRYIKRRLRSDLEAEQIVDLLVQRLADSLRADVPWRPGASELVRALAVKGVPQALVTMSYTSIAEPVAAALPFDAVVTGDAVTHGKPNPEAYLTAAALLGVEASACLAIEDSRTGAASADAAGCLVLVVPHMVEVPDGPRRVFRSGLDGMTPGDLVEIWDARPATNDEGSR